jgi:hypothetical protein
MERSGRSIQINVYGLRSSFIKTIANKYLLKLCEDIQTNQVILSYFLEKDIQTSANSLANY